MGKFQKTAILAGAAMMALASSASAISNDSECEIEGGTMINVKNSDYCLVPIRDKAYSDPVYDGNQLGVVECPGDKLNEGKYCMYPVTIRPAPATTTPASADASEQKPMTKEKAEDTK